MCGIVGAIGAGIDTTLLHSLFLETEDRGKHATGFWFPNTGIIKEPKKATDFLNDNGEAFTQGATESRIFLGHTRFATHGRPENNFNNHPLESENWIIVHNGVIATMRDIDYYQYKSDTDTENLLAYIEHYGLEKGLAFCSSGASIILINKAEEDVLYLWRTYSQPMKLGYDMSNETIYIYSEDKFLWTSLASELKEEKILGGLFKHVVLERKMKVSEPKSRELWKISIKADDKLECELLDTIENKTTSNYNTHYYNNTTYHGGFRHQGNAHLQHEKKEDQGVFVVNRQGKNRPRVITWKAHQEKTAAIITKEITKSNGGSSLTPAPIVGLLPNDIVQIKRRITHTDQVQASGGGRLLSLSLEETFLIRKHLANERIAVEDITGVVFVIPAALLKLTPSPVCLGTSYDSHSSKCENCHFHSDCAAIHYSHAGEELPGCAGTFKTDDDDCAICPWLVPCLSKLEKKTDYINKEFAEANIAVTTGED